MAREVVIHSWCDRCMSDGQRVEATSYEIMITGMTKPHEIDLCSNHDQGIQDVLAIIDKYGRTADGSGAPQATATKRRSPKPSSEKQRRLARDPSAIACPVCLNLYTGTADPRSKYVGAHLRSAHQDSINNYSDQDLEAATAEARSRIMDHD